MEANLLKSKEDIEDICISAVKEKDIEAKLKSVISDWGNIDLSFSQFKARGELLLKGQVNGELCLCACVCKYVYLCMYVCMWTCVCMCMCTWVGTCVMYMHMKVLYIACCICLLHVHARGGHRYEGFQRLFDYCCFYVTYMFIQISKSNVGDSLCCTEWFAALGRWFM